MSQIVHEVTSKRRIDDVLRSIDTRGIELKDSPGKGRGVFAAKDFSKNDFLTVYPSHAIGIQLDSERVAWSCMRNYTPEYVDNMSKYYALAVMGGTIAGDPERHDAGLGHMVNDGARSHSPADVDIYRRVSMAKENVAPYVMGIRLDINDYVVFMRATRDITKGEELFYSYGATYWGEDYE